MKGFYQEKKCSIFPVFCLFVCFPNLSMLGMLRLGFLVWLEISFKKRAKEGVSRALVVLEQS